MCALKYLAIIELFFVISCSATEMIPTEQKKEYIRSELQESNFSKDQELLNSLKLKLENPNVGEVVKVLNDIKDYGYDEIKESKDLFTFFLKVLNLIDSRHELYKNNDKIKTAIDEIIDYFEEDSPDPED